MSWEEAGGAGNAIKGYCMFGQVSSRDRGFLVATEFLVLCRDMVLRLQIVAWSRHYIFMSRQRFSCRGRDGRVKLHLSCCNMFGLGRDFFVAIEYFCVATEFG